MTKSKRSLLALVLLGLTVVGVVGTWVVHAQSTEREQRAASDGAPPPRLPFWRISEIPARQTDSAARANYEGVATDDWDELGAEARVRRTQALVTNLEQRMSASVNEGDREQMREQALQAMSNARADFFMEPESQEWYVRHEAGLEE